MKDKLLDRVYSFVIFSLVVVMLFGLASRLSHPEPAVVPDLICVEAAKLRQQTEGRPDVPLTEDELLACMPAPTFSLRW